MGAVATNRDDEIAWLRAQQIALAEEYKVTPHDGLELGICDLFAEELILEGHSAMSTETDPTMN